ncbi:hypothetical protein MKZ38_000661 [Zalerion maritima]|uniref:Uncharacterized protein n=1 Tax=Zalerion maritima TaxID=339359 RepID=A0AAD5WUA7_9PEZI|nr:hypothetical protein MKZ38_000661 [Zalerion maritima]
MTDSNGADDNMSWVTAQTGGEQSEPPLVHESFAALNLGPPPHPPPRRRPPLHTGQRQAPPVAPLLLDPSRHASPQPVREETRPSLSVPRPMRPSKTRSPTRRGSISSISRIYLQVSCNVPAHTHSQHDADRGIVCRSSRRVRDLYPDSLLVPLVPMDRGYSCLILESMVQTWKTSSHVRVRPGMDDFQELYELSLALWDYQCSTQPFKNFADTTVRSLFDYDHEYRKARSKAWAFIAVVFWYPTEFGRSIMDVRELPEMSAGHLHKPPSPTSPSSFQYPTPVDLQVLRTIVPPELHENIKTEVQSWIYDTYTGLLTTRETRRLGDKLRETFEEYGYIVVKPGDNPTSNSSGSINSNSSEARFFSQRTVVDLYRILLVFVGPGITTSRQQQPSLRANVVIGSRFAWPFTRQDPSSIKRKVDDWYHKTFSDMVYQREEVREKFNEVRSVMTGLQDEVLSSDHHELPAMSGGASGFAGAPPPMQHMSRGSFDATRIGGVMVNAYGPLEQQQDLRPRSPSRGPPWSGVANGDHGYTASPVGYEPGGSIAARVVDGNGVTSNGEDHMGGRDENEDEIQVEEGHVENHSPHSYLGHWNNAV